VQPIYFITKFRFGKRKNEKVVDIFFVKSQVFHVRLYLPAEKSGFEF